MRKILKACMRYLEAEDGPTAVEYAVMLSLIVVGSMVAIESLGSKVSSTFAQVGTSISQSTAPSTSVKPEPTTSFTVSP